MLEFIYNIFILYTFVLAQEMPPGEDFTNFIDTLDLTSPKVTLDYKSGTTSVGLKILIDGKYEAYWLPNENGAGKAEPQVVTYKLSQLLGLSDITLPSEYYYVSGEPLKRFYYFLKNTPESGKLKLENKNLVINAVSKNINNKSQHFGAIALQKKKFSVDSMVSQNNLKLSHPLVNFLKASSPHPSPQKIYSGLDSEMKKEYKNGEINMATELQLAKDLSNIMVLDALTGQWDRFSGGNLEARFFYTDKISKKGRIRFYARDNGGGSISSKTPTSSNFTKYINTVSRFDRETIKKVEELDELLETDSKLAVKKLGIKSSPSSTKARTEKLLLHIESLVKKYGEDKVFFNN